MDKVLIVDDELELLDSLKKDLQNYETQFEVLTALDGEKAIEVLKRESITVLVTDLAKPKVDGFGLLAHMTKNHPLTPCIVTTEYGKPHKKGGEKSPPTHKFKFLYFYFLVLFT